jgi:hypothetical protein
MPLVVNAAKTINKAVILPDARIIPKACGATESVD